MDPINFPYKPYPQQEKLMKAIYDCVSTSSIGCFESPTGTGKSMVSLYATYSWLIQEEERLLKELWVLLLIYSNEICLYIIIIWQAKFKN